MYYGAQEKILNPHLDYSLLKLLCSLNFCCNVACNSNLGWTELLWTCYFLYMQVLFTQEVINLFQDTNCLIPLYHKNCWRHNEDFNNIC